MSSINGSTGFTYGQARDAIYRADITINVAGSTARDGHLTKDEAEAAQKYAREHGASNQEIGFWDQVVANYAHVSQIVNDGNARGGSIENQLSHDDIMMTIPLSHWDPNMGFGNPAWNDLPIDYGLF